MAASSACRIGCRRQARLAMVRLVRSASWALRESSHPLQIPSGWGAAATAMVGAASGESRRANGRLIRHGRSLLVCKHLLSRSHLQRAFRGCGRPTVGISLRPRSGTASSAMPTMTAAATAPSPREPCTAGSFSSGRPAWRCGSSPTAASCEALTSSRSRSRAVNLRASSWSRRRQASHFSRWVRASFASASEARSNW